MGDQEERIICPGLEREDLDIENSLRPKSLDDYLEAKYEMKKEVFKYISDVAQKRFDPNVLTITWARRFADYKRAWLIFMDKERITKLLNNNQIQLIFAGKFHPDDTMGKEMFNQILQISFARYSPIMRSPKQRTFALL